MKRILLILFVCCGLLTEAQVYNNEWIDYNKTYYKFMVRPDAVGRGLYRISHPTLTAAGLATNPVEHFQLWRDGQEVPIYTSIPTGVMGGSDYIEFWGERNNGKMDKALYRQPEFQLNEKWSLQTDSATYFLTVNTTGPNLRLVPTLNDIAGNTLPVEPFFIHTAGEYYGAKLNPGFAAVVGEYVYSSSYDQGEGWTSSDIGTGVTFTNLQTNLNVYSGAGAPQPVFRINATGNALNPRNFLVNINGDSVFGKTMDYFDYTRSEAPLSLALISGGTANVAITNRSTTPNDRMSVAQFEIVYPRTFNFNNARNFFFTLPANAAGNYLEITNFNYNSVQPVLYDLTNHKRYAVNIDNPSILKIALQPSAVNRELVLVAEDLSNAIFVTGLQQRNFIDFSQPANQGDYIIISHPILTNGANGTDPIEGYRAYRSSAAGGGYNAKTIMIDQLVDQFGYGVKMHPIAIRNFTRWSRNNFATQPKGFFLIGKGVVYQTFRLLENEPRMNELNLVPTFGNPGSDNLLTTDAGSQIPVTPIGRLSVISAAEVALYLAKVIEYEQSQAFTSPLIADKAWMKNVAHVVGASDPALQSILDSYMARYSDIIADTLYGANVHKFSKSSTEAVQQLNNTRITNLFEQGIGLLTYFGHSSATTLEFNLDEPNAYNNQAKYPIFIALGCNAGNFFTYSLQRFDAKTTLSEKFVLAPNRGTIAFIASTHFGIVHYLDIMNTRFYEAVSDTRYNRNLGEAHIEAITQVFNLTTQNDYYARFHCEQATIHGDPVIKLHNFAKPDYVIEPPLVKITPTFISVAETEFKVDAKFINMGKAINDSITVEVKRTYPNQTTEVIGRYRVRGTRYIDSLIFDIPIVPTRDKGLNKITITLDADNTTSELYETNNTVTKDVVIYEDEARPIFPYNYAIIKDQNTKFLASTANPFSESKQYRMEMDTTELFNSPLKITRTITSSGGILEFVPGLTFADSTVYYWRVAPTPITGQPVWNKSSFIYIPNHDFGFNQSHLYQHFKSDFERMKLDSASRELSYKDVTTNIFVRNGVFPSACSQASCLAVAINGDPYIRSVCGQGGIIFHVLDPITMKPWINGPVGTGLYGSDAVCGPTRIYNFQYNLLDTNKRRKIVEFLDLIPDDYYVVVRNISGTDPAGNTYASTWKGDTSYLGSGNSMYHRMLAQGFTTIDSFDRPRAFAFVYRKNRQATFTPAMAFSAGILDNLTLSVDCPSRDTLGYMTSPVFGPALAWKELQWRGTADTPGDDVTVDVIGIRQDGTEIGIYTGLTPAQQNFDVSAISVGQFPYLRLRMRTQDSVKFTPYQLRYWRLTYDPAPEGAIAPNLYLKTRDVLEVGEPLDFKIAFKNISNTPFDSLKVKMVITDRNNVPNIVPLPRKRPLGVNGSATDTIHIASLINTGNLPGLNTLYVEANPDNDQPEQYHFNNFAYRSIYVKPDSLNPLLDVTFDGVHILNRDIVSSKPDIIVKLKDEARWLVLDDTSLLTLQVKFPNGSIRRYYFNNDTLQFTPAGTAPNPDNTATLTFRPFFATDGEYELIVSGKDKSENTAGNMQYRVAFQVINKPMISNMLNYPNPFTTSTAFVFTITGSEVPQNIKIEIMTITGKIVREITKNELGALHIGRNITEFKWDGTDQFGSKLANGIYLYRVVTNLNGKELDKYKAEGDNTDKFFNKGYGKMVLMR